jgi:hypothetical protein
VRFKLGFLREHQGQKDSIRSPAVQGWLSLYELCEETDSQVQDPATLFPNLQGKGDKNIVFSLNQSQL